MYYSTRNRRRLTFETLMTMPSEPESRAFYTYTDGDDKIEVLNDTFTLVLSRDVRKNSRIGAEIAFQIAKERPQDDVLYVNTYAGVALMKEAFSKALAKSGMIAGGEPSPEPVAIDREIEDEQVQDDEDEQEEDEQDEDEQDEDEQDEDEQEEDDDDEWVDPDDDSDDEEYGQEPSILGNLFIHDVPFGTWDTYRLERDIEDRGRRKCHTIVVLNSFEFASMSRDSKARMAKELIELRSKLGLSFVVFSHEPRWDLAAGLPGRGPIGIISANAGSVQRLNDPFENLIRHRKEQQSREKKEAKREEKAVIHEAQMRGGNFVRKGFYLKVPEFRSEFERDRWLREQKELPDYHVDPWLGKTQKTGRELLMLARSRVLQRYFEKHADYIFTKGYEPTEYELLTGTYEAKEFQKKWLI